ncbi:MAG: hypothetical protein ACC661_11050 [Verrucomicrobiales bacterium]
MNRNIQKTRLHCKDTPATNREILDCLMLVDLSSGDPRMPRRYLGEEEGAASFLACHGVSESPSRIAMSLDAIKGL